MRRCLAIALLCAGLPVLADDARRLERAIDLYAAERVDEARVLLDDLLQDEPRNHRALWNRGLLAMHDEETDEAVEWFERAIAVEDADAEYHLWLGYAHARRVREVNAFRKPFVASKIRRSFERAVDLAPANVKARRALMRYYEEAPLIVGGSRKRALQQADAIARLERTGQP